MSEVHEKLDNAAKWLSGTNYDHIGYGLVNLARAIVYAVDKLTETVEIKGEARE